jgi:tetratricopeptide (TPR) repeat protein
MRFIQYLLLVAIALFALPGVVPAGPSIHDYTLAIEDSPEDMQYKFYLLRGKAYKDTGEMNLALQDLSTSIKLDPSMMAYKYRGEVFFKMGRYANAANDFTYALEFNQTLQLYKLRGESYLKSGIDVLAFADGLNIIAMAPDDAESYYVSMEALENLGDVKLAREQAFKVLSFDRGNKKANEIITRYPLKFVFIGDDPVTIYIREGDYKMKNKTNEILLRSKRGEKLEEYLKNKLNECTRFGGQIKEYQGRLEDIWDTYFAEVRSLKVRSRKIHDDLKNKYREQGETVEREIDRWESKSERCTEELVAAFESSE